MLVSFNLKMAGILDQTEYYKSSGRFKIHGDKTLVGNIIGLTDHSITTHTFTFFTEQFI